jgi:hypothetical protein
MVRLPLHRRYKLSLFLIPLSAVLMACTSNRALVPPILQGATAKGGWWGACPPSSQTEAEGIKTMRQLALSPEFNARLNLTFPVGSSEQALSDSLLKVGFHDAGHCKSDPSIKIASFYAKGSGLLPYATVAEVYWQTDGDRIVWTKGFVRYSGL